MGVLASKPDWQDSIDKAIETIEDKCKAIQFIVGANLERHGELILYLDNKYTMVYDANQSTLAEVHNLLLHWRSTMEKVW